MSVEMSNTASLEDALNKLDQLFVPFASKAISESLGALESTISPYPPQPARNRSKRFNTYVRGVGFYPRSAFTADSKEPGGFKVKRKKGMTIRMTSQQMDKRYKQVVKVNPDGVEGHLLNTATYSGFVIGHKDEQAPYHQAPYHKETGWPNQDDVLTQVTPFIDGKRDEAIDSLIKAIKGE